MDEISLPQTPIYLFVNHVVVAFCPVNRSADSPFLYLFRVDMILIKHESVKEAKKAIA
ncbi:MAG TPA: hypothetical protein VGD14_11645 [bacterium]